MEYEMVSMISHVYDICISLFNLVIDLSIEAKLLSKNLLALKFRIIYFSIALADKCSNR